MPLEMATILKTVMSLTKSNRIFRLLKLKTGFQKMNTNTGQYSQIQNVLLLTSWNWGATRLLYIWQPSFRLFRGGVNCVRLPNLHFPYPRKFGQMYILRVLEFVGQQKYLVPEIHWIYLLYPNCILKSILVSFWIPVRRSLQLWDNIIF